MQERALHSSMSGTRINFITVQQSRGYTCTTFIRIPGAVQPTVASYILHTLAGRCPGGMYIYCSLSPTKPQH
jgi:hypothetical protein